MLITPFVAVFGAVAYYFCGEYLQADKEAVEAVTKHKTPDPPEEALNSLPPSPRASTSSDSDEPLPQDSADTDRLMPEVAFKGGGR